METYLEFLKSKIVLAKESGFDVDPGEINPNLKPHQRDSVIWALRGGRRALFQSFGLGKTVQEIEFCHQAVAHDGGRALIVLPLGVRQEFARDAEKILGYQAPVYITKMQDLEGTDAEIVMTNYERVRDGDIDPTQFTAVALDEASVLRSFGSKTYQTFLPKFRGVKYKLVCTATPSPNRFKELIHYAGYLEIMDTGKIQAAYRKYSRGTVYDYAEHVRMAKELDAEDKLPATFMVVAPGSWTDQVWDDINRMRTLNTTQSQRRQQMHVCPLQLDIVDRLINRYSNPGELVLDPFGGLGTVALEAMKAGRRGYTIELNNGYFRDAVGYLKEYEQEDMNISLFDMMEETK